MYGSYQVKQVRPKGQQGQRLFNSVNYIQTALHVWFLSGQIGC